MNQNVSNISNDGESDYNISILIGEAPDIVELPSPSTTSKIKKMSFLAKVKNLTELFQNVKATQEKISNDILL